MITAIREVRRAKGMTLDDVARLCVPPTTAQTIGRLETGTRTVSVGWLNRIAGALSVTAAGLVEQPDRRRPGRDRARDTVAAVAVTGPPAGRRRQSKAMPRQATDGALTGAVLEKLGGPCLGRGEARPRSLAACGDGLAAANF